MSPKSLRDSSRRRRERPRRSGALSLHILPASATMIGVCVTVISLVRVFEVSGGVGTFIDRAVAVDALIFLTAAVLSYMAMRSMVAGRRAQRLENYADITFVVALGILAVMAFLFAWEIGYASS